MRANICLINKRWCPPGTYCDFRASGPEALHHRNGIKQCCTTLIEKIAVFTFDFLKKVVQTHL